MACAVPAGWAYRSPWGSSNPWRPAVWRSQISWDSSARQPFDIRPHGRNSKPWYTEVSITEKSRDPVAFGDESSDSFAKDHATQTATRNRCNLTNPRSFQPDMTPESREASFPHDQPGQASCQWRKFWSIRASGSLKGSQPEGFPQLEIPIFLNWNNVGKTMP